MKLKPNAYRTEELIDRKILGVRMHTGVQVGAEVVKSIRAGERSAHLATSQYGMVCEYVTRAGKSECIVIPYTNISHWDYSVISDEIAVKKAG